MSWLCSHPRIAKKKRKKSIYLIFHLLPYLDAFILLSLNYLAYVVYKSASRENKNTEFLSMRHPFLTNAFHTKKRE